MFTHLSKTFVTLHCHALVRTLSEFLCSFCTLSIGPAVNLLLALLYKIKRRSRKIYIAVPDEVEHISEEECKNQCCNVASVHIGIGHDDDLMVTELAEVHPLLSVLIFLGYGHAESRIDIADFLTVECPVLGSLFHIENLTSQRKDCLDATVTALFSRTACRISLDEEELALFRITL